jgi:hypothetical protein
LDLTFCHLELTSTGYFVVLLLYVTVSHSTLECDSAHCVLISHVKLAFGIKTCECVWMLFTQALRDTNHFPKRSSFEKKGMNLDVDHKYAPVSPLKLNLNELEEGNECQLLAVEESNPCRNTLGGVFIWRSRKIEVYS